MNDNKISQLCGNIAYKIWWLADSLHDCSFSPVSARFTAFRAKGGKVELCQKPSPEREQSSPPTKTISRPLSRHGINFQRGQAAKFIPGRQEPRLRWSQTANHSYADRLRKMDGKFSSICGLFQLKGSPFALNALFWSKYSTILHNAVRCDFAVKVRCGLRHKKYETTRQRHPAELVCNWLGFLFPPRNFRCAEISLGINNNSSCLFLSSR